MKITEIKTPSDILEFMKQNIKYGWLDINNEEHIDNMKNFRKMYRTSTIDEVLEHGIGTCIEQVFLMKYLLDKINLPNKMFCIRNYEDGSIDDLEASVRMHCFIIYYYNGKAYQIEHPNWQRMGIYEFNSEEEAIREINDGYVKHGEINRVITEFYDVQPNLSFKEFNEYINSLDIYDNAKIR